MLKAMSSRLKQCKASRRERRTERLTARAADLSKSQDHDLLFLHQKGFVRARATGQSITQIHGEVESLIRKTLRVVIKPGTYSVSSGNYQNMVTRCEYSFTLYPCTSRNVSINASCINSGRPIPTEKNRFYGVRRVSNDLARFLDATQNTDPMVVQAGVWALTDNYSGQDIQTRLVLRDQYGNTHQAVSTANIAEARSILNNLGIHHRL